ncbi:HU family DNA-binding protein [Hyphomicrobiales bacterium]|jgi:integration host factor subunit alpha|uniref:HU family DNA-binding protein n=1 Tax=Rhizobium sp. 11_C7_N12_5 TaxID=3240770 RepID=UPI000DDF80EC
MTITTMTRADLADAVIQKTSIPRSLSADLVDLVFEEISDALGRGEAVTISSFATFQGHDKRERKGRNPKTGEIHTIAPRRVISFTASKGMKSLIQDAHKVRSANTKSSRPNPDR